MGQGRTVPSECQVLSLLVTRLHTSFLSRVPQILGQKTSGPLARQWGWQAGLQAKPVCPKSSYGPPGTGYSCVHHS